MTDTIALQIETLGKEMAALKDKDPQKYFEMLKTLNAQLADLNIELRKLKEDMQTDAATA